MTFQNLLIKRSGGKKVSNTQPSKTLIVDGREVCFSKKKIKNINLRISRGGTKINVSAPTWMPEQQVVAFVESKNAWISQQLEKAQKTQQHLTGETPEKLEEYKQYIMKEAPLLLADWEQHMGVKANKLAFRNMTSRWGSCNPQTGRICINIQLARYPYECLEYVVVHELCHLLERGHGEKFKALMTQYLPDWEQRRRLLKGT